MAKAQELGIKIINEDEFLKMITDLSSKKSSDKPEIKKEIKKEKSPHKSRDKSKDKSSVKDKKDNHVDSKSKKSPEKVKTESKSSLDDSKNRDKFKTPKKIKEEIKAEPQSEKKAEVNAANTSNSRVNGKKPYINKYEINSVFCWQYNNSQSSYFIFQHIFMHSNILLPTNIPVSTLLFNFNILLSHENICRSYKTIT